MSKIGRNELCPCGSEKKYKKCCIGKVYENNIDNSFLSYTKRNGSKELLKMFSLLQLIPKNHSKLVRLETIQDTIISSLNGINNPINYHELQNTIHKNYETDYREDPSEASFTENITFLNGNNIVFPGIAHEATNINQCLLYSIFFIENELSKPTKNKIREGAIFLLSIFNEIALKLGYTRYLFEDDYRNKITFPKESFIQKHKELFVFSEKSIKEVYAKLKIKTDIIAEFTSTIGEVKNNKKEETVLINKPFIKIKNEFYLVLPSAEMYCLNQFIINVANENNELGLLKQSYDKVIKNELSKYLTPYWSKKQFEIKLNIDESIWQFDTNKYAYVCYLSNTPKSNIEQRANKVIKSIKKEINSDNTEFFTLHFFAQFSIKEMLLFGFKIIKESEYQLPMNVFNLGRIISYWDINKLTLWKYAKARERADKKRVEIAPFFSILTYFKWYKRNKDSFFLTDDKSPNMISFDFAMQGEIVIQTNKKDDRHFIYYIDKNNGLGYIPVIKTETFAPIYTSEEIFDGYLKVAIEKFNCPIWVTCKERYDFHGKNFVDAILYWLNELEEPLKKLLIPFDKYPIEIELSFEKNLLEITSEDDIDSNNGKINIEFNINPKLRKIELLIPKSIFNALHRVDNHGERILMNAIIRGINNLLIIFDYDRIEEEYTHQILNNYMPLSRSKMILTADSFDNIKMNGSHIPRIRYIYDADTAIVLEENIGWLPKKIDIPKKIRTKQEKESLCLKLIDSLINQLRIRQKTYDSNTLLPFLMLRHEALSHSLGKRDLSVTARIECFNKYEDVIESYQEYNGELVKASHSIRCLIEFVVAEPYFGSKTVNDDDVDFLLAIMTEIINYGAIKDSIKFNIDNPEMGLLPSGRIGISHDFYDNVLTSYRKSVTKDEILDYDESFDIKFKRKKRITSSDQKKNDLYYDKVDEAFLLDWGITLPMIIAANGFLSDYCFENKNSYYSCTEDEFKSILRDGTKMEDKNIDAYIEYMALNTRGRMDRPKELNDYPEIFPWRYNRKYSYIRRPVLKMKNADNSYTFSWSARHIDMASDNLLALFHNGALKVENTKKGINRLLAKRNNIKGKEFREEVFYWLKNNPNLMVIPFEVKIKENGMFNADRNYGDVDIMAFDIKKKILYSIECKNTKQAKIMYDFQNDLKNYFEKQIPKHLNREEWLKKNVNIVLEVFRIGSKNFKVKSVVISSYQLPIKFMKKTKTPIYSLNEIKMNNIF